MNDAGYPLHRMLTAPPTAEEHLDFLTKVERLLAEGRFTSTYKFALLVALTNLAVEHGDDSGEPLEVDLDELARRFLALYWNMARPYPRIGEILRQNRDIAKPSRMITLLKDEVSVAQSSHQRLRRYAGRRDALVAETRRTLAKDVLYRLQTVGQGSEPNPDRFFLYDHPPTAAECLQLRGITLKPGVAACFRRLRGVVIAMVQARWALWIRENNAALAADRELESFLFGAARTPVGIHAERFYELQDGRCFYTEARLGAPKSGEVDHFIPWARYPFDSPFNLVLASRKVNNAFRDSLKPIDARDRWLARNELLADVIVARFDAMPDDRHLAARIARWIYREAS